MKPTAMQMPPDKGGKMKDTVPPPTLPKHSSTVTVVCNGTRASSDHRLSDDFSQLNMEQAGGDAAFRQHRSVIRIDSQKKIPPPVSPRERHHDFEAKSPPPVLPRPNSTSSIGSASDCGATNGHCDDGPNCVTDLDFFASLPPLPSDELVALPYSVTPSGTTSNASASLSRLSSEFPQNNAELSSSEAAGTASAFYSTTPPHVPNTPTDAEIGPTRVSVGHPAQVPYAGHAASTVGHNALTVGHTAPTAGHHSPQLGNVAPPVPRKPAVSRPPPMSGISENGTYQLEETTEEGGEEEEDDVLTEMHQEVFHIHMKQTDSSNGGGNLLGTSSSDPTFAGRRDVRDPGSLHERKIVSAKGTVRGFKNRVRAGIATFLLDLPSSKNNYRIQEKGRIVVYLTSMSVVRETHDRCKGACNILQTHMVRYEARDLYMSREHQRQLRDRLETTEYVPPPQIFADGIHLGGAEDLEKLNESGELRKILENFPKIQVRIMCDKCGGYRWVPCSVCHGSKKSVHRNNFTEEFCALRCMNCNESGLQRCQECLDQQE